MPKNASAFRFALHNHRARHGLKLGDQARAFGCSVAYISAVELGRKSAPTDYADRFADWLKLGDEERRELRELAKGEKRVIKLKPADKERAAVANEFADALNELPIERVRRLRDLLTSSAPKKHSVEDIERLALVARSLLELGTRLTFDLLDIVEDKLKEAYPKFAIDIDPETTSERVRAYTDPKNAEGPRLVISEQLYVDASNQSAEARYKLAHELGHLLLHKQRRHADADFHRCARIEAEADCFAREFLLPAVAVRQFGTPTELAHACNVPRRVASRRMREMGLWPTARERERVIRGFAELLAYLRRKNEAVTPLARRPSDAQIIRFPKENRALRHHQREYHVARENELPLFAFASSRSDKRGES